MLAELFAILAPVLITAGIGYGWARSGQEFPSTFIAQLTLRIGTPALVLSALTRTRIEPDAFLEMVLACVLVTGLMGLAGWSISRLLRKDWRILVPAFLFSNTGNLGLPICLYAFGEPGLALAVAFFIVLSVSQFSLGELLAGERSLKKALLNPTLLSVALALPVVFLELQLPRWLQNSLNLLGGMAIPLMLLTLGVSLATIRARHLAQGLLLGGLRVGCGALLAWLVGTGLGVPALTLGVLILQAAMPVGVFNYLFALRANRSPEEVASLVLCSTLLALLLLPLLLAWLLPTLRLN